MMYDDAIKHFLLKSAVLLQAESVKKAPFVTGKLRGDIGVFPQTKSNEISVGNTLAIDYAVFVYYGTKAHSIRPRNKKALKTPYGAFKKVNHPGTKPNPYLDKALENIVSSGKLRNLLDEFSDEMSDEMFKNISKSLSNMSVK